MSNKKEILKESKEIIEKYKLVRHKEGGYFIELYTSSTYLPSKSVLEGSIYFLLDQNEISKFHRIGCEEIWYYHKGIGINIYFIEKDNTISVRQLDM